MSSILHRHLGLLLCVLLLSSQLALLGHVVFDDHDKTGSCEICLKAKSTEVEHSGSALSLGLLALGFTLALALVAFAPLQRHFLPYLSRAPPAAP